MTSPTLDDATSSTAPNRTRIQLISNGLIALLLLAGVAPRLAVARMGHNFDMESWTIAADLFLSGQNVYDHTPRYNYGPPWFVILGGLRWLEHHTAASLHVSGPEAFHVYVAAFLAIIDLAIAGMLWRRFDAMPALLFMYCPVSVLISGYHGQFDNLAILIAMAAWVTLQRRNNDSSPSWPRVLCAGVLLGCSLATKHVMVLLPIWLLLARPSMLPRAKSILIVVIAFAIFAVSFAPFAQTPEAREGIRKHVFDYRSQVGENALFVRVVDLALPYILLDRPLKLSGLPLPSGLMVLFIGAMLTIGRFVARRRLEELLLYYVCALVVCSIAWAEQYLAIPLIACVVWRRRWAAWVYVLAATCVLIRSPNFEGFLGGQQLLTDLLGRHTFRPYHATIWLVPLMLHEWLTPRWRGSLRNLWTAVRA